MKNNKKIQKKILNMNNYDEAVDISESKIHKKDDSLLKILLKDKTTGKNLIWGTKDYEKIGHYYTKKSHLKVDLIIGINGNIIKPRVEKNKEQQQTRTSEKAEVFTPSWICNKQNNIIDNKWFGEENIFNKETERGWRTNLTTIKFKKALKKTWKDYVKLIRLEVACGEAPYLTSRYDSVSGDSIKVKDRIGLLDRKLRVINENVNNKNEWIKWAEHALKSIYGYDYQGDNVLLARENILYTTKDYYEEKFKQELAKDTLRKFAKIISWNIWQMDSIKFVVPYSCKFETKLKIPLPKKNATAQGCKGCKKNDKYLHNGTYCKIMDWETKNTINFIDLTREN